MNGIILHELNALTLCIKTFRSSTDKIDLNFVLYIFQYNSDVAMVCILLVFILI